MKILSNFNGKSSSLTLVTLPALLLTATLAIFSLAGCGDGGDETRFLSIGTGGETGVYYPTGGAVAKVVNENTGNLRVTAGTSKGSVDNINSLLSGQIDFGIAQSDAQYNAFTGQGPWEGNPEEELRHVMSLYPEMVTLVAAADAGIDSVEDLAGKRVNLGQPGSGTRNNAMMVLQAAGLSPSDLQQADELAAKEAPRILQDNRLDAFFYTVGHPAGAFEEAMAGNRKLKFISLSNVDRITTQYPFMQPATIEKSLYPRAEGSDARTVGLTTTFMTTNELPEEVVYQVVKAVVENLDALKQTHPALSTLTPEKLAKPGSAPFHAGAERYFQEADLLPDTPAAMKAVPTGENAEEAGAEPAETQE